ncbi:MAG: VirB4 family type IV secretion/conjugal transfer ATPase, partial [Pseudomonadota bacterium]
PIFSKRIRDWLNTIRKRNGLLGFGSQSARDALNSSISDAIIEQSPTQIFTPNIRADRAAYCDGFGLSDQEFTIIKELPEHSRCFLLKQRSHSVVARLDLTGLDSILAVLSGREESLALLDRIRAKVGGNPDQWLPQFQEVFTHGERRQTHA